MAIEHRPIGVGRQAQPPAQPIEAGQDGTVGGEAAPGRDLQRGVRDAEPFRHQASGVFGVFADDQVRSPLPRQREERGQALCRVREEDIARHIVRLHGWPCFGLRFRRGLLGL